MASAAVDANLTSSATLASDLIPLFIKERTLMLSERQLVLFQFGDRETLLEGQGKTVQFTRYERLVLPNTPLTEGQTPSPQQLTTAVVQAIVDQWGAVVALTDVGMLTVRHPVLRIAQDRISMQHSELIDREIEDVIAGGTNVTFANGRGSRSTLVAGDVPNTDLIRQIVANLRQQGAPAYEGGHYVGVVDPFTEMDLTKDATFVNAASYSNIRALYNGEIGMWMGVRWMRSNFLPIRFYLPTVGDTGTLFTAAAATAAPAGTTGLAAVAITWEVTRLDPQTGQEIAISRANTITPSAGASLDITGTAAMPAGTYNFYVSLQGSAVPVYQVTLALAGAPAAIVVKFVLAGTQTLSSGTGANAPVVVVQGLGAVAPPAAPQVGTSGVGPNVHELFVFGKEAFGVVDLSGLSTTITPATATDSDPLVQRRKIGWKQMFKSVIKNPNFYSRAECLSAFN